MRSVHPSVTVQRAPAPLLKAHTLRGFKLYWLLDWWLVAKAAIFFVSTAVSPFLQSRQLDRILLSCGAIGPVPSDAKSSSDTRFFKDARCCIFYYLADCVPARLVSFKKLIWTRSTSRKPNPPTIVCSNKKVHWLHCKAPHKNKQRHTKCYQCNPMHAA